MLLFAIWATLAIGALAGAGYSHYRYRVRHNRYYERLFAKETLPDATHHPQGRGYALVAVTLIMVCVLVPMSLLI